jgi:hypothetical protein
MKTGDLLKVVISKEGRIHAWKPDNINISLGNMYKGDIVIYLKDTDNELFYIDVISKYGIVSILKMYANETW